MAEWHGRRGAVAVPFACLFLVLSVAFALVAAGAQARVPRSAHFSVQGSDGYRLKFEAQGRGFAPIPEAPSFLGGPAPGKRASVPSWDVKPLSVVINRGHSEARYFDRSGRKFSLHGFSGSFGQFGRVDVKFHENRRYEVKLLPGCSGRVVRRVGRFVGLIRFRGEGGYTDVHTLKAHGVVNVPHSVHCGRSREPPLAADTLPGSLIRAPDSPDPNSQLAAQKKARGGRFVTTLFAFPAVRTGVPGFLAILREEQRPRVYVDRFTFHNPPGGFLTFGHRPETAHLRAPRRGPLHGSARLRGINDWRGPLWASLIGAPHVRLTGKVFHAHIQHQRLGH